MLVRFLGEIDYGGRFLATRNEIRIAKIYLVEKTNGVYAHLRIGSPSQQESEQDRCEEIEEEEEEEEEEEWEETTGYCRGVTDQSESRNTILVRALRVSLS
uniref:Uncharacterized protein n=1 Tax=Vespula pensylvanica TaxID=30213 RepID=A0A834P177_VESPE|nr:hypothetical protein H0235_009116 [Vespula pensylvanica]